MEVLAFVGKLHILKGNKEINTLMIIMIVTKGEQ